MISHRTLTSSKINTVKSHNLRAVLLILLRHEPVSRVHLAKRTGLSIVAITDLIAELMGQGIITEQGTEQPSRRRRAGHPRTALRLAPEARRVVGIHIGVGSIRVAVASLHAQLWNCLPDPRRTQTLSQSAGRNNHPGRNGNLWEWSKPAAGDRHGYKGLGDRLTPRTANDRIR